MQLAEEWEVPVYCHHKEKPYLTGLASYPPADPAVGGGAMSLFSFAYPKGPINVEWYLKELEMDQNSDGQLEQGPVPELEDWRWLSTPGHSAGHISLFREKDGVLIAGDAIVTTMSESLVSIALQKKYVSGPPKYFTPDWGSATQSVKLLNDLQPNVIATGHGPSMYGMEARRELNKLVREFWKWGIPASGRYVKEPAEFDENGIPVYIPEANRSMLKKIAVAAGLLVLGYILFKQRKNTSGFQKKLAEKLGKTLMTSSLGALGATAPAVPAMPKIPVIPAI
jgi:glyoxylase-like metal-dependent hydrolase (beta-lactamase superfamily II)